MVDPFDESTRRLIESIDNVDLTTYPYDDDQLLQMLKESTFSPIITSFSKVVPNFQRLTINRTLPDNKNETIRDLKLLKYPPSESVTKIGRANLKNQSILYGTFILPTAVFELKPTIGDLVTISVWTLKNTNTSLVVFPIIDYNKCSDFQLLKEFDKALRDLPEGLKDIIISDNCIIAKCFSKFVEKGKSTNYLFSASYADSIFKYNGGEIEAIIYPSVQDPVNSANIAIKPQAFDDKYRISEIRECIVISHNILGLYLKNIKVTDSLDDKGNIIWK